MDLTGKTLLDKYEIEMLLGQGGMAAVWLARHVLTGRKIAIKVLDESYMGNDHVTRRFLREARAASAVAHPGIVEVIDIDEMEGGLPFIVMEFLEGETLARRIEKRGRLEQEEAVRLFVMLLEGLEAAHTHGVVHRDLKPENIYVVPAGRRGEIVKILDFGISHMVEDDQQKLTMTGSVLGTPHYMSPEQAMGETEVDQRADLYAAGVVLYECVVGDVPFDAPNYNKLLRRILDEFPQTPRERGAQISESVERVILWAMEKEREKRLDSAQGMLDWLLKADAGETVPYQRVIPRHSRPQAELDELDIPVQVDTQPETPEAPPKWEISDELIAGGAPPPRSAEIEVRPPPPEPEALEIDEVALADSRTRSSSGTIPAVRTSSSTGQHAAIISERPPAPASEPPPSSGLHTVPQRVAHLSGGYDRPAPRVEPERPAWQRYLLFGVLGVAAFVGLVFLVRWVVEPGPGTNVGPQPVQRFEEVEDAGPSLPRWVSIRVVGLPPGARMQLDGLPASSPMRLRRGTEHTIEITADAYEDRRIELTADRNRSIHARMVPAVGAVQDGP